MRNRSALGTVLGAVLSAWTALDSDPISEAVGIHPDPRPSLERLAQRHGWTLEEVVDEAERRTSPRWAYMAGLGALEGSAQTLRFRFEQAGIV